MDYQSEAIQTNSYRKINGMVVSMVCELTKNKYNVNYWQSFHEDPWVWNPCSFHNLLPFSRFLLPLFLPSLHVSSDCFSHFFCLSISFLDIVTQLSYIFHHSFCPPSSLLSPFNVLDYLALTCTPSAFLAVLIRKELMWKHTRIMKSLPWANNTIIIYSIPLTQSMLKLMQMKQTDLAIHRYLRSER